MFLKQKNRAETGNIRNKFGRDEIVWQTTETGETGAAKYEGERVTGEEKKENILTFGEPGKSGASTSKAQQQTKRAGEERSFFRAEGMAVEMRDFCVAKPTNRKLPVTVLNLSEPCRFPRFFPAI